MSAVDNHAWIEAQTAAYLQEELASGDPARVRRAQIALDANSQYGIGGWCWGDESDTLEVVSLRVPQVIRSESM